MTRLRPRSFYDALAAVALFLLLAGGGAYAAATIGAADIQKDAVRSYHIKDGQVTHVDLALNSVGSLKIFDGALSRADLKPGALPLGALSFDRHLDPGTLDSIGPVRGLTLTFLCASPTASDVHVGWRITPDDGHTPVLHEGTVAVDGQLSDAQGTEVEYSIRSLGATADVNLAARLVSKGKWVRYVVAAGYGGGGGCNFGGLITPLSQ